MGFLLPLTSLTALTELKVGWIRVPDSGSEDDEVDDDYKEGLELAFTTTEVSHASMDTLASDQPHIQYLMMPKNALHLLTGLRQINQQRAVLQVAIRWTDQRKWPNKPDPTSAVVDRLQSAGTTWCTAPAM